MLDLLVLAANRDLQLTLDTILSRPKVYALRPLTWKTLTHPQRDRGCFEEGERLLRTLVRQSQHALVVLNRRSSGHDHLQREGIETEIENRLARSGWEDRAAAIVVDPELEAWVWSQPGGIATLLKWQDQSPSLDEPKGAFEAALREAKVPKSASLFQQMAKNVRFRRCEDPAFRKLRGQLQAWFPIS
jgi:hypothetical protein